MDMPFSTAERLFLLSSADAATAADMAGTMNMLVGSSSSYLREAHIKIEFFYDHYDDSCRFVVYFDEILFGDSHLMSALASTL
ncbi:hypothetical protein V9T40_004440 [Parthenolecanium corni]|uniref:Uncharacterized protein n=1 Tax=Parthenolecanium corni TaxID=536013 RepID=A0AAN9TUX6_9HEMI